MAQSVVFPTFQQNFQQQPQLQQQQQQAQMIQLQYQKLQKQFQQKQLQLQIQMHKIQQINQWYQCQQSQGQTDSTLTQDTISSQGQQSGQTQLLLQQQYLFQQWQQQQQLLQMRKQFYQSLQQLQGLPQNTYSSQQQSAVYPQKKVRPPVPKFMENPPIEDIKEQQEVHESIVNYESPDGQNSSEEEKKNSFIFCEQPSSFSPNQSSSVQEEEEEITDSSSQTTQPLTVTTTTTPATEEKKLDDDHTETHTYSQKYQGFQKKKLTKLEILIDQLLRNLECNNNLLREHCLLLNEKIVQTDHECLKSRNQETLAAAIIIFCSRLIANPITTRKVAKYIECKERTLNKIFKYLKEAFDQGGIARLPDPVVFLKQFMAKLNLPESQLAAGEALIKQIQAQGLLNGQNPATTAACVMKITMNLNGMEITASKISEISGVCSLSLRNSYKHFFPHIPSLVKQIPNYQSQFTVSSQFLSEHFN